MSIDEDCPHLRVEWMEIFEDIDVPTGTEGLVCADCGEILEKHPLNN